MNEPKVGNQGPATDRKNEPVMDPTENVMKLVEAANRRQDDLRHETTVRIDSELRHLKDMAELRAAHSKEMRAAEADRLNSIRQVDVTAVKTEADRALAAIQTLAATTATNAENLRNALTNTATTIAKQTADTVQQITERIAALEKSNYEGQGKSMYTNPMLADVSAQLKNLTQSRDVSGGERRGGQQMYGWIVGAVGVLLALASFVAKGL